MRRCTRYSMLLACLRRSRSRFKAWTGGFHGLHSGHHQHHQNIEQKGHRPQKGIQALRGVFQGPDASQSLDQSQRSSRGKMARRGRPTSQRHQIPTADSSSGSRRAGSNSSSGERAAATESPSGANCCGRDVEKRWDARRRDSRVNGADIYVARFTKSGTGTAKPCWRCLEWCRWAGVKRIFHWNAEELKFEMVKVNSAQLDQYETHADIRLFAGLVRVISFLGSRLS